METPRSPVRRWLAAALLLATWLVPATASAQEATWVIRADQAPEIQGMFEDVCGPGPAALQVHKNRADLTVPTEAGGSCRASLLPPDWDGEIPPGVSGVEIGSFTVLVAPDCPEDCADHLLERAGEVGFEWGVSDSPRRQGDERRLESDLRSALVLAVLGVLLWVLLAWFLVHQLRRCARALGGWGAAGVASLVVAALALFGSLAWQRAIRDNDELVDFSQSLVALFSGLRLSEYWMPALFTSVATLAMAPYLVGHALLMDAPLEQAIPASLLGHTVEALWLARMVSVGAWVALLVIVFRLARRFGGATAGVLAVALTWTLAVDQSLLWATTYTPYALAIALSWAFVLVALGDEADSPMLDRQAASCGVLAGAAFSSHGLAILFAPLLPWAALRRAPDAWLRRTVVFGLALVLAYVAINFHLFTDLGAYLANWRYRLGEIVTREDVPDAPLHNPYFQRLLDRSQRLLQLGVLLSVAFLVRQRRTLDWRAWTVAALPIWLLLLLSLFQTRFARYLTYVYPSLVVLGGLGWSWAVRLLPWTLLRRFAVTALVGLCLLDLVGSFMGYRGEPLRTADPVPIAEELTRDVVAPDDRVVALTRLPYLEGAADRGRISHDLLERIGDALERRVPGRWTSVAALHVSPAGDVSGEGVPQLREADWLYAVLCCDPNPVPEALDLDGTRLPVVATDATEGFSFHARHVLVDLRPLRSQEGGSGR